jgi:hypothetical protein
MVSIFRLFEEAVYNLALALTNRLYSGITMNANIESIASIVADLKTFINQVGELLEKNPTASLLKPEGPDAIDLSEDGSR